MSTIHHTAVVHPTATVDPMAALGAQAIVGSGATIGAHARIGDLQAGSYQVELPSNNEMVAAALAAAGVEFVGEIESKIFSFDGT